jgi:two-component system phosphate regulon sensor histidine kinase PhoR
MSLFQRILLRVSAPLFLTLSGSAIGGLAALFGEFDSPFELPLAGALAGALISSARDRIRGTRLIRWLQSDPSAGAPADGGFWGELGYRIEKALRQHERTAQAERDRLDYFLAAIDASPNGVMLLDERGRIRWCNRMAAEHFGLDPVRDRFQPIVNLVRQPEFVAYLQEGDFGQVIRVPARFGRTLSIQARDPGDGLLVLSQDISERVKTEMLRREFVANVSHELRTPLTVLSGYVETLATIDMSAEERARTVARMAEQAARMQALLGDSLTLAELEGSTRPAIDLWVPVARLFETCAREALALSGGGHRLECETPGAGFEIAGSDHELRSALTNLLSNAVRYTPAGGRIGLSWTTLAQGGGRIEVEDNGPGIAPEHLPRLTERFYRVDQGRSRESGGTGLGLAIVRQVMQRHGGEVRVESEVGRGSRFMLVFPASRVRGPGLAAESARP